jgi:oligosaccharide repeat unit polymerase
MCVRIGAFDSETINLVHGKFRLYAFSEIQAFSVFLENRQYDLTSLGFGKNTFMSIYNLFSGESKVAGVYTIMEGTETNVFTAYRGLIEDYSFVGTLVFEFIVGFISGVSLKAIKRNRPSTIALVALAISYYFILYSFIISPWIYTIEILMFVIMFIVFLLFFRRKVIKNKKSIMKSRVTRYV